MEPRPAAILYAEVSTGGWPAGADGEAREALRRAHLDALNGSIIDAGGRTVSEAGEAVVAEFADVLEALTCAVAVQRDLAKRDTVAGQKRTLRFRIGVAAGEVASDDEKTRGAGVDVAARMAGLAEPGGICVAEQVFTEAADKLDVGFGFLGQKTIDRIDQPVNAYEIYLRLQPPDQARIEPKRIKPPVWPWLLAVAAIWAVIVVVAMAL